MQDTSGLRRNDSTLMMLYRRFTKGINRQFEDEPIFKRKTPMPEKTAPMPSVRHE